jgi:ribosomal protein S18 acetylase RimI-like enzyme
MYVHADDLTAVAVRRIRIPDDVHPCAQMMSESEPWVTLRRTYEEAFKMLSDPAREVYVAVVGDEIAGFTVLRMKGIFVGYIQTVGVMPEWRNRGIGTRLIRFAEQRIFEKYPNVFICVSSFNERAQKLYLRLGYEVVGELRDFIVPGHSEILLRKTIGPMRGFKKASTSDMYLLRGNPSPDITESVD